MRLCTTQEERKTNGFALNQEVYLIGFDHKASNLRIREQLATTKISDFNQYLDNHEIQEIMIISTCNRIEILFIGSKNDLYNSVLLTWINKYHLPSNVLSCAYKFRGMEAVAHLFKVASGMESMIFGEPQILGQLKGIYQMIAKNRTTGVILHRLLQHTFYAAKRIRSETAIGLCSVTLGSIVLKIIKDTFTNIWDHKVLFIGAGEIITLLTPYFIKLNAKMYFANRTFSKAKQLANAYHGEVVQLQDIEHKAKEVDVVISCVNTRTYILKQHEFEKMAHDRNSPLLCIDLSVPRSIDPSIDTLHYANIYNIDMLKEIINKNYINRQAEITKATSIVNAEVKSFFYWANSLDTKVVIANFYKASDSICRAEIDKILKKISTINSEEGEKLQQTLEQAFASMSRKILHLFIDYLKNDKKIKFASQVT